MVEMVTCSNCGQRMSRVFYETQHRFTCGETVSLGASKAPTRKQKTIHVEGLPHLTLKIRTKCGIVQVHPDLTKHFPDLPKEWEGCDSLMLVTGVPEWGTIGTLSYTYSSDYKMGFLEHIFLWEDFRGKGIAREMHRFAFQDMREKGVENIFTSIVREEWVPRMKVAGFRLVEGTERLYVLGKSARAKQLV